MTVARILRGRLAVERRVGGGRRRYVPVNPRNAAVEKVVRDSFTMPRGDYNLIDALKQRCIGLGIAKSKSELLRAGLAALHHMPDASLTRVVMAVESVKTGRPRSAKKKKAKGRRKKGRKK